MGLIDSEKAIKALTHWGTEATDEEIIYTINNLPTVEAIPKAEVKKFLEEGTKNVSNNVLAIVREDYIHKSDYENRLKADLVDILDKVRNEIDKIHEREGSSFDCLNALDELKEFIDKLKAEKVVEDGKHF